MSDKKSEVDEFSKARKKHRVRRVVSGSLLLFAILYVPIILIASGGARAEIALVTTGTISDSIKTEGMILKDEQLLYLPFDGVYTRLASEGERIPAGYSVASVVDEAYASKLKELEELGDEILLRKKDGDASSGIFTRDLQGIEDKIKETVGEIVTLTVSGRVDGLSSLEDEMNRLESARDEIISGSVTSDQYTEDLEQRYRVLSESLAGKMTEIKVDEPGYISYTTDGYEGVFTRDVIYGFSVDETLAAIRQFGKGKQETNQGEAFAKLVTGNSYTIVTVLDKSDADRLRSLSSVTLKTDEPALSFKTEGIELGASNGNKTVVYLRINSKLGELASVRKLSFEITLYEYNGLMVPVRSLLNFDAYPIRQVELAKVKDNWVDFIPVKVLAENGTQAIIEPIEGTLNLYDYYAVRPRRVKEGQVVR